MGSLVKRRPGAAECSNLWVNGNLVRTPILASLQNLLNLISLWPDIHYCDSQKARDSPLVASFVAHRPVNL
jgi:hypothetical protein